VKFARRRAFSDGAAAKPRAVLADDHPDVLKSLARLLSFELDVVAAVTDGDQALDACRRLDPQVVLLDVTMPGRDGFQTARDLRQRESPARIIFLTMHESEEFVAEAFRSGGCGYVLKTRLHLDLVNAVKRVLAGQLVLPSLRSLFAIDEGQVGHVVQFYDDEHEFVDGVDGLITAALRRGDAVSVVSSEHVRANLARRLAAFASKDSEPGKYGRYRDMDSMVAASSILWNGHVDADRVAEIVTDLDRWRQTVAGPQSRLTVVGDISSQFLAAGNLHAVRDLEHAWNELTSTLPFLTVCGYPMMQFSGELDEELLPQVCAEHFAVAHTPAARAGFSSM
jgi:CheY-like chemotaxis protein